MAGSPTAHRWTLLALLLLTLGEAWAYTVSDLKITVTSTKGGEGGATHRLNFMKRLEEPLTLHSGDGLRFVYNVRDDTAAGEDGVEAAQFKVPHQNMVVLQHLSTGLDASVFASMKENGRSRIDLTLASLPSHIRNLSGPFKVDLILGDPATGDSLRWTISDSIILSNDGSGSSKSHEYGPQPEIRWSFDTEGKRPPVGISSSFILIVLSPWIVLLSLWAWLGVNLSAYSRMPPSIGGPTFLFIFCLTAYEFLFYQYWARLRLPDLLLYGTILALITFVVGRQSLSGLIKLRKRQEGLAAKKTI